jgi:hypothetical protein
VSHRALIPTVDPTLDEEVDMGEEPTREARRGQEAEELAIADRLAELKDNTVIGEAAARASNVLRALAHGRAISSAGKDPCPSAHGRC